MLSPSAEFISAIALREVSITELYKLELLDGNIRYFTPHDEDIIWGGVTYQRLPIVRDNITTKVNLEAEKVNITLANITSELVEVLQANVLDGSIVTIKRILYKEEFAEGMEITLFVGVADVSYNRAALILSCTSILDSLNILVPRCIYGEPCNNRLYDVTCEADKVANGVNGTATADATIKFTLTDAGLGAAVDVYALGELYITSGRNSGVRKLIRSNTATVFTIVTPFQYEIVTGDIYTAYPGCDKRPETCRDTFSNIENFYGFSYIPKPEETMF